MQKTPVNNYFKIKRFLLDLFFPKFCLGCQREGTFLCQDCKEILDINQFDCCLCENHPQTLAPHSENRKCPKCQNKKLDGLFFALPYEKQLIKNLIHQFKYSPYLKNLAEDLAKIISDHFILSGINNKIFENSILIPVPIHEKKLKLRGYNQSEELAKELSKIFEIPMENSVLIKIKSTKNQMELKKEEREKNLENSFEIKNPEKIQDKKIFLVDDVYTTGSTMQECALALRRSGAKKVYGVCITRGG